MKIRTEYVLPAKPEEVYGYFLNADNMSEAWPPEMRMRIISREGNLFTVKFNYLGQQYTATFKIEELGGLRQYHETLDFPFGALRHWITVEPHDSGSKLTEVMELRSPNPLAGPIFRRILRYREQAIKHHFGAAPKPVFKDPLKIGLVAGTVASILPIILAYVLLYIPPPPFPGGRFILALISWALLWFFTHDLAHLFVGMLAGIRFSPLRLRRSRGSGPRSGLRQQSQTRRQKIPHKKQLRSPSTHPGGFLHGLGAVAGDWGGLEEFEAPQVFENCDSFGAWFEGRPHALSLR